MGVKCFLLEPTERQRRYLRRYRGAGDHPCLVNHYHDAWVLIDVIPDKGEPISDGRGEFEHDERWPKKCDRCDYLFTENDHYQVFLDRIYARKDTGEEMTLRDAPPGAMWDANWLHDLIPGMGWTGPDGRSLVAVCPGGHQWHIDGRCSNCTRPHEPHQCWIRHGEPPNITVDKNGNTCAAGAGSIQTPNWHGFLRDGYLVE